MGETIGFIVTAGHLDIEWYQPMRSYRFWTVEDRDTGRYPSQALVNT